MPRNAAATRALIIEAADELMYGEGIRGVSMDMIAEKAGVTKRTLYYHFRSKDELIAAYLEKRDEPTFAIFAGWLGRGEGALADKIAGMFRRLGQAARNPQWKGCGYLRAAAELAGAPGHPALKVGSSHKKRFEAWLQDLIAAEGLDDAAQRAREIMVLLDGAVSQLLLHRDPAYAEAAGRVAAALLGRKVEPSALDRAPDQPALRLHRSSASAR
jgi:AcrR family transcriptional regulator